MSVEKVIGMLRENPRSIPEEDRAEMLRLLEFDAHDIIDLAGHKLKHVRAEMRKANLDLKRLHKLGWENQRLLDFLHAFALSAISAGSPAALVRAARRHARAFGIAEGIAVVPEAGLGKLARATVRWKRLLAEGVATGGRIPLEFKPCLGRGAGAVRSHVMVRIGKRTSRRRWLGVFSSRAQRGLSAEGSGDFIMKFAETAHAALEALEKGGRK